MFDRNKRKGVIVYDEASMIDEVNVTEETVETPVVEIKEDKKEEVKPNRAARRAMEKNQHKKVHKRGHMDDKRQWFKYVQYLNMVDGMRSKLNEQQDNVKSVDMTTGEATSETE